MVRLYEGEGRAPQVHAMLEMEDERWVCALTGREVRLFKVRCTRGLKSNGEG